MPGFILVTSHPFWFVLLCLLAGMGYAALLYYRDKRDEFNRKLVIALAILRALAVSFISFLLLSPLFKTVHRTSEKPIVALALDNTASIAAARDSVQYKKQFVKDFSELADKLSRKFEVVTYTFGDKVSSGLQADFKAKETDMSQLFAELTNRYSNRNLAALVLAGDGIFNRGSDPLYVAENAPYAIYTVALGDTAKHRDISVARVNYNRVAYLGNDFPIEVHILATDCAGQKAAVALSNGKQTLGTNSFTIGSRQFSTSFVFKVKASASGMQHYRVSVSGIAGEWNTRNNAEDIFVEVIENKEKVLLLYATPHPDIAALKASMEVNKGFTVESAEANDFKGNIADYSLVVLYQIPNLNDAGSRVVNLLKNSSATVIYVLGNQSNLAAFNNLQTGFTATPAGNSFTQATPVVNKDFGMFTLGNNVMQMLETMPPLSSPFAQYKQSAAMQTLFYQRIGEIPTRFPLLLFSNGAGQKSAVIVGEGLWKWRMTAFAKTGSHQLFDGFMAKILQFLAVKEDKSRFRVFVKNHFYENELIEFDAELYNESYELINEPEVKLEITGEKNTQYPYAFTRNGQAYYINAGSLAAGDYSYVATTQLGNNRFEKKGAFTVVGLNVEYANTVANHLLLNNLAASHKGKMYSSNQLNELADALLKQDDFKTVQYAQKRFTGLIDLLPALLLIIALLATEWFLRKRNGSY